MDTNESIHEREYDATDIAFKNDYQRAVNEVFDKLEKEFFATLLIIPENITRHSMI